MFSKLIGYIVSQASLLEVKRDTPRSKWISGTPHFMTRSPTLFELIPSMEELLIAIEIIIIYFKRIYIIFDDKLWVEA